MSERKELTISLTTHDGWSKYVDYHTIKIEDNKVVCVDFDNNVTVYDPHDFKYFHIMLCGFEGEDD